ncbi:hypothetical protein Tco_0829098, partial [Tanacetum coccineum]
METKDTLSLCSYSDEQDMQQMLKRAKILKGSCLNDLNALKSNFTRKLEEGITKSEFERAFSHIFGEDVDTFTRTSVLIKPSSLDDMYARKDFHAYTSMQPQLFKETILKNFDFIEDYMLKTIIHAQTIQKRLDDKKLQIQECTVQEVKASDAFSEDKAQEKKCCMIQTTEDKVDTGKAVDASLVNTESIRTEGNDAYAEDADIRPIYDEEPMVEVQTTAEINIFA